MANGPIFRRVLVVTTHLTVVENAHVILVFKSDCFSQAYQFAGIFPRDEMIRKALLDEKRYEVSKRTFPLQRTDKVFLSPRVFYNAEKRGSVPHEGM